MNFKTNIALIRLFSFIWLCIIVCTSCTKEKQEPEVRIQISRYQILVDNKRVDLPGPSIFGRPDITQAYRAYRYDKQALMYIPSIVDFNNLFIERDAYYLLAIREEQTLNVADGGSTYYLEKTIAKYNELFPLPFEESSTSSNKPLTDQI